MTLSERVILADKFGSIAKAETNQVKLIKFSRAEARHNSLRGINSIKINQNEQNKQQHKSKSKSKSDVTAAKEPFQLVWTGLSFTVRSRNYDKFLSTALNWTRSLSRLGESQNKTMSDKEKQQKDEDKSWKTPYESATNEQNSKQISTKILDLSFDRRVIFENLNGYINSGELSAILGPSGSGKTSLLNAICGRTEDYTGRIRLIGGGSRRMRLSIIPQKDYLIENLTVRENLLYSSRILNPDRNFDHEANIVHVVRMLNLTTCFQSIAANISGGEYKRVSIAQELLRQPDILILDEPTSGLDSLNCKNLIGSLVQLIRASRDGLMKPIAIVMTIHQPDVEIFHMFDHVYCLARGGRVIYDGHPRDAMQVIRSQANLATDRRLAYQLGRDAKSPSPSANDNNDTDQIDLSSPLMMTNPANLMIEIASQDVYGPEPIERLARFQLKQFDQMHDSTASGTADMKHPLRRLHINMLMEDGHKDPTADNAKGTSIGMEFVHSDGAISRVTESQLHQETSPSPSPSSSVQSIGPTSSVGDKSSLARRIAGSNLHRDKRLNVKNDHSGLFWYHTKVLSQRAFVSTIRDPLMTLISLLFHLSIPFVMWTVYPKRIGYTNGCPLSQRELDIVSMASNRTAAKLQDLQEQVTTTLECSTMFFLTTYSFSMCSLSVAALAFPLSMHILLKEVRNGWYNLPTYVLAKTIANFPFEVLFPVISLVMIYVMLGMPSSYMEWRLCSIALVMALVSMISHTQGLIFGALCMDSVQTAIFLASASSLPQTLLSGFTARIKNMPLVLQRLSWFSQYRYSSDLINMIRFGFNTCPCDHTTDEYLRSREPDFTDIPKNLKPMFVYYLVNNTPDPDELLNSTSLINGTVNAVSNSTNLPIDLVPESRILGVDYELMLNHTERYELLKRMEANEVDLFAQMADMISRSFSFGRRLDGCPSVRSQILVTGGTPADEFLPWMFGCMLGLLILGKILLFIVVRYKIGNRV